MFEPIRENVLIRPIDMGDTTKGGIVIPDVAKEKPRIGKVVAVGPGGFDDRGARIPMQVKENDTVLYGAYSGYDVTIEEDQYKVMRESEILLVVRG